MKGESRLSFLSAAKLLSELAVCSGWLLARDGMLSRVESDMGVINPSYAVDDSETSVEAKGFKCERSRNSPGARPGRGAGGASVDSCVELYNDPVDWLVKDAGVPGS